MLDADGVAGAVEVARLSGANVDRSQAQPRVAGVDVLEVDQALQRCAQRGRVVVAQRRWGGLGREPGGQPAAPEEPGLAHQSRPQGAGQVVGSTQGEGRRPPRHRNLERLCNAVPELAQLAGPLFRGVAGDDGGVDGPDGDSCYPVRAEARLLQRPVDPHLVGAQRPTTLEDQRDPVVWFPLMRALAHVVTSVAVLGGLRRLLSRRSCGATLTWSPPS
ncbi:MAG: hypothetical protein M3O70_27165, partial [Actinomycetota bacterium]|nr:hypothetical protein [Actinomycetota bacterium]